MPQGKAEKYQVGGSVDPFSSKNPESILAQNEMEAIEGQGVVPETNTIEGGGEFASLPEANAMERSQSSPIGNEVGTGVYSTGGMVRLERERRKERAKLEDRKKKLGQKSKEEMKAIEKRDYEKRVKKREKSYQEKQKRRKGDWKKSLDDSLKGKGKGLAAPPKKKKKKKKKEWEGQA